MPFQNPINAVPVLLGTVHIRLGGLQIAPGEEGELIEPPNPTPPFGGWGLVESSSPCLIEMGGVGERGSDRRTQGRRGRVREWPETNGVGARYGPVARCD